MDRLEARASRYAVICPVCRESIRPVQFSIGKGTFRCPMCGELLQYTRENIWLVLPISIASAIILGFYLGYRGFTFALVTICAASVIFFLGISIAYQLHPPKAQQSLKNSDVGLRLGDKPRR